MKGMFSSPSPAQLLGLVGNDGEDLEKLSTRELKFAHAVEHDRLGLARTVGAAGGAVGLLALVRYLGRAF